jgi:hypothetical protein
VNLTITGMSLDGHTVDIPNGLSELVNSAGAWGIKKSSSNLNEYDRQVQRRDGSLVTVLTYKGGVLNGR